MLCPCCFCVNEKIFCWHRNLLHLVAYFSLRCHTIHSSMNTMCIVKSWTTTFVSRFISSSTCWACWSMSFWNFNNAEAHQRGRLFPSNYLRQSDPNNWNVTYLGGRLRGERGFSFSSSFFSLASRGGRILGLSFSSRLILSLSHSSFRRILSFSRSRSLSLSLSLCRRSLSRWSLSLSLSRFRSRGSRSRSRSCRGRLV